MTTCTAACGAVMGVVGAGTGCVPVVGAVVGTGSVCAGRSSRGVVQRGEVKGVTSNEQYRLRINLGNLNYG